jgi:hypothetical protein
MTIDNRTHWSTADLKRIIARVAREELNDTPRQKYQRKHLRARIVYTHGPWVSGCAYLRGTSATLRLPKTNASPREFAWLVAHELAHVRGVKHAQMPGWLMHYTEGSRERYQWANALGIGVEPKVVKVKPTTDAKLAHVRAMLAKAQTRVKRATTIQKKWQARERYYLNKLTASLVEAAGSSEGGQ